MSNSGVGDRRDFSSKSESYKVCPSTYRFSFRRALLERLPVLMEGEKGLVENSEGYLIGVLGRML
jgi:hypothetical protein